MTEPWPASPFWDFSLEVYGRPGVEAACLALQDRHGMDVNLVLLAAWLAEAGRRLEPPLAARLRQLGDGWQATVMQPMREARRGLKAHAPGHDLAALHAACRRSLMRTELDLERLEQLQLERLATAAGNASAPPASLLQTNLATLYPDRELPRDILSLLAARLTEPRSAVPDQHRSA